MPAMFGAIVDLLFPPQCAACRAIGTGLCSRCVTPGDPPVTRMLPSLRADGLGEYRGALRAAVLALKDGRRDVARTLGERLTSLVAVPMTLVPVCTTRRRRRIRGIDGVEYVARIAARCSGAHVLPALRPLRGDAQRGRSREQRIAARERFWCDGGAVRGLHVTLVDDVCTTGTTLEDCAQSLRAAGASVSQALVIAVANP
jgi:predicted amidophosphoribosyltransferase